MDRLAERGFFNPHYKPHAKGCWDAAMVEATEEEGSEGWTREQRAKRRCEIYDRKMKEVECSQEVV